MLTQSQQKTYTFIKQFMSEHGHAPTAPEIAEGIGIQSTGVVHRYVHALAAAGLITIQPRRHRGIELVQEEDSPDYSIPLLGKIAAGLPIEAIPQQETLALDQMLLGANRFALLVAGDSMIEAGIFDGDYVICQATPVAKQRDIIVALIYQQETTLKYYHNNGNGLVTLVPANSRLAPQTYNANDVIIQGVVVGQLRSYQK